jgi:hypothetical protein
MASVELVHPVDNTWLTPRRPSAIEISLDTIPTIETGIAYGEILWNSPAKYSAYCRSATSAPPPPLPMTTPKSGMSGSRPESFSASRAASTAMRETLE